MAMPMTVFDMFQRRVAVNGPEPFLVEPSGAALSFIDVRGLADAVAEQLEEAGSRPGAVVALYLPNSPEWVVASLAVWSLGSTVAAVNRLIPPAAALDLISMSQAATVCADEGDDLRPIEACVTVSTNIDVVPSTARQVERRLRPEPDDDAAIIFTSGTTGHPKGLAFTHRQLSRHGQEQATAYSKVSMFRDSMAPPRVAPLVSYTAFGHMAPYASLAFALWSGRRLALVPKFTVEATRDLLNNYDIAALRLNPAALHMLATTPVELDFSGVRYVYSGTAPLSGKTRALFSSRYGVPILQGYGQTETGPISLSRYEDVVSGREPPGSVGRVLRRLEVRIADSDDSPVPCGNEGEIQVRSDQTSTPISNSTMSVSSDGFVRTGDLGTLDAEGFLTLTGRAGDKMVVGGFNVMPAEVEEALRQCDYVVDAVVVGLPDDRLGERPVAGVVWRESSRPDLAEVVARKHLAAYKVPRDWFDLEEIPTTDRGKVNRRAATELALRQLNGFDA